LVVFVVAVAGEHFIESSLDPATHEISEYANGRDGGLMIAGFVAWSASLAVAGSICAKVQRGRLLPALMGIAAVGLAVTATFATQTSAGRLPPGTALSTAGWLHDVGSGATSVSLFAAALISLRTFRDFDAFRARAATLLGLVVAVDIGLLALGPGVAGIRQRMLVVAGCIWEAMIIAAIWEIIAREAEPLGVDDDVS